MSIYKNDDVNYTYWATWDHPYLLPHLMRKVDQYYQKLEKDGILNLWQEVDNAFYNYEDDEHAGSQIRFYGPGGEIVSIRSSVFRNMIKHMLNGVFSQQPQYIPVAANDDFDVKAQVFACKKALEHYHRKKDMQQVFTHTGTHAVLKGVGYTVQTWDKYHNDLVVMSYGPRRVITDLQAFHDPKWFIVTERVNKWDVVARYEVPKNKIDQLTNHNIASSGNYSEVAGAGYLFDATSYNEDYIDLFHFYHDRTPALPEGRLVTFCNDYTEFTSETQEILPYSSMPIHMLLPDKILDSPYGYSPAFDIIAYTKLYDSALSTMYTQLDNARSIVGMPDGSSDPIPAENDPSLTIVKYPAERAGSGIQVVNTYNVPEGIFKTMEITKQNVMETTGQNQTTMGESEAKSGSHAALLHTVSQQFNAPFITRFVTHIEETGTAQIGIIKHYVDDPIDLKIAGENNEYYIEKFKGEDITDVDSTFCRAVSPMLSTQAGRLTIAQDLMKLPNSGFTARDYVKVIDTGQLDSAYTEPREADMTLSQERDMLSNYQSLNVVTVVLDRADGGQDEIEVIEEVRALVTDPHDMHLAYHSKTLSSPKIRNNPQLVRMHRIHMREHVWLKKNGDPDFLMASGQQPAQPPAQPVQMIAPQMANPQRPNPQQLPAGPSLPSGPQNPMNPTAQAGPPNPQVQ